MASDPGLGRLRMALGGAGSMITALGVELVAGTLLGASGMRLLFFLLMGGIVAMMGSMALSGLGPGIWIKVRTAVFFPVAFGFGLTAGVLTHGEPDLVLVVFVVMTFLAVLVRRFGIPFFFYGFMAWIGYLFASLLGATFAMLPTLLLALAIGTAWVLLLSMTVLGTNTARTVNRTVRAFHARMRTVTAVCADLADIDPNDPGEFGRWQVRLHRQQSRLSEAALMIEASSGEQRAVPDAETGHRLRSYILQAQLAVDALAGSVEAIAAADPGRAEQAATVAASLARRDLSGARSAAEALHQSVRQDPDPQAGDWWVAYRLCEAVAEFTELADRATDFSPAGPSRSATRGSGDSSGEPAPEFRPAVGLMMGNLPSSAALAGGVAPRGPSWLRDRISMTTRQAIQVALASGLAILVGHAVSGNRYYWALIAVFVTFTGTATRAESVRKAVYRLVGTLVGLVAAMLLAHVTAGNPALVIVVIVLSLFCGFYLIRISYAFMIFFITIMVAQLYTVLGSYSDGLLVLRLEETAIGAGIGIVVALLFLPLSTRDTVHSARDTVLSTLERVLTTVADRIDVPAARSDAGPSSQHGRTEQDAGEEDAGEEDAGEEEEPPGLDELSRQLDDAVRQLAAVATPFSRPAMWGGNGRRVRYRLNRFAAIATAVRGVTVTMRRHAPSREPALAEICRGLAAFVTSLTIDGRPAGAVHGVHTPVDIDGLGRRLQQRLPDAEPPRHDGLTRSLLRINDLLGEIARLEPHASADTGTVVHGAAGDTASSAEVPLSARGGLGTLADVLHGPDNGSHDGNGVLSGTVRTLGGRTARATLLLLDSRGRQVDKAQTDTGGGYRLHCPRPGTYTLICTPDSHEDAAAQAQRVATDGRSCTCEVVLTGTTTPAPRRTGPTLEGHF